MKVSKYDFTGSVNKILKGFRLKNMKNILGIDGSKSGWIGVKQNTKGGSPSEIIFNRKLIDFLSTDIELIIIDMPVGLDKNIKQGGRLVDKEARKKLLKRKSSIFNAPIRDVLKAKNYDEANNISKSKGLGISKQSWNLVSKINELDQILQIKIRPQIYESHPELCFQTMNNGELKFSKKERLGIKERKNILIKNGFDRKFIDNNLKKNKNFQPDDFLDACALSWTAKRIINKKNINLPEDPERDELGIIMQMKV